MKRLAFCLIFLFQLFFCHAQERDVVVPYTLADRDRAVRMEVRLNDFEGRLNLLDSRIIETNKKIDRLEDKFDRYFIWGFGLVLMSIFGLIGFIIYDRRTVLEPIENKTERVIKILRRAAENNPDLKEDLKNAGFW